MENPNGIVEGNQVNNPTTTVPRSRSTFNLGYHFFDTHRFGEYHPHFVAEGVKDDKLPIRSSHDLMTYTLESPLMQNITMHKDYFTVPMSAILPLNWDKFFENPVRGDDVSQAVGPTVSSFFNRFGTLVETCNQSLRSILQNTSTSDNIALQASLRFAILGEYVYSNGSLLASLGCHGAPYIKINKLVTSTGMSYLIDWDTFFDDLINFITSNIATTDGYLFTATIGDYAYSVYTSVRRSEREGHISLRHALTLMRDDPQFEITSIAPSVSLPTLLDGFMANYTFAAIKSSIDLNLSRLWAYQLVCAHYYSNDSIDFIYTAELFRQLVGNYLFSVVNSSGTAQLQDFFTYNGIKYQYDNLSAYVFQKIINYITTTLTNSFLGATVSATNKKNVACCWGYISALFGYRRSLRYQDYFTGSRAQPLAVGNVGVSVSNNTVSVIDVTRNIQRQRFLNAVNRIRHNTEAYLQGLFGGELPAPDYHNPFILCQTSDVIYGQETENTGNAQMTDKLAITTNLRSNGSRYMFEIDVDRPCVILGLTYYDIPRVYAKSIERPFFHKDRFDYFNPFEQFIGDQQIYVNELGIDQSTSVLGSYQDFSYTLRHMEFKQRYNQCAGGFVNNLPGFAFLALDSRGSQYTINPDWIRSVPSELDPFYVSLTGYSLGTYWHFIVDNFNDCTGSRPMVYAPSIL